eukprot:scaffold3511_cov92-Cylindrotheca_fusiformis.AAC.2
MKSWYYELANGIIYMPMGGIRKEKRMLEQSIAKSSDHPHGPIVQMDGLRSPAMSERLALSEKKPK